MSLKRKRKEGRREGGRKGGRKGERREGGREGRKREGEKEKEPGLVKKSSPLPALSLNFWLSTYSTLYKVPCL